MDIELRANAFQPKGGMCGSCASRENDCSELDFEDMPIISIELEEIIVRCTEFKRTPVNTP